MGRLKAVSEPFVPIELHATKATVPIIPNFYFVIGLRQMLFLPELLAE